MILIKLNKTRHPSSLAEFAGGPESNKVKQLKNPLPSLAGSYLPGHFPLFRRFLILLDDELSATSVHEMSRRPAEIDRGTQFHFLQILRHFPTVGEARMDVGKVNFNDEIHVSQIIVR